MNLDEYRNGARCANAIRSYYGFNAAMRDMRSVEATAPASDYLAGQVDALLFAVTSDERLGVSRS